MTHTEDLAEETCAGRSPDELVRGLAASAQAALADWEAGFTGDALAAVRQLELACAALRLRYGQRD